MSRFASAEAFCADVLALRDYEPVIARLLSGNPGEWVDVALLAKQNRLPLPSLAPLRGGLFATWLRAPEQHRDPGVEIVVFCMPVELWSMMANVHRSALRS